MFGLFKKKKMSNEKMDRLLSAMLKDLFGDKTSGVKFGVDFAGDKKDESVFAFVNPKTSKVTFEDYKKSLGEENLCNAEKQLIGVMAHLNEIESKLTMIASASGMNFVTKPAVLAQPERIELVKMEVNNPSKLSKNK